MSKQEKEKRVFKTLFSQELEESNKAYLKKLEAYKAQFKGK